MMSFFNSHIKNHNDQCSLYLNQRLMNLSASRSSPVRNSTT